MNKQYHVGRQNRIDLIYRLRRRTDEVTRVIRKYFAPADYSRLNCLDIGTADGLMLSKLNKLFRFNKAIGIDMSEELINTNEDEKIKLEIGNAENLKFGDDEFDIVVACAVIEHVDDPNKMLAECFRVLRKGGILIITTPNPIHDKIATRLQYFKEENHVDVFNLKRLRKLLTTNNFHTLVAKNFMFFPFFKIPGEDHIETFILFVGLAIIMPNQLIVGQK